MYKTINNKILGAKTQYIKRVSDGVYIPENLENSDYQTYLKWLDGYELQGMEWVKTSDGNTPLPADEPNEGTV